MILDAAETVLGYFGFDRSVYGNEKKIGPRKWRWLQDLRQERENDIKTEVSAKVIVHIKDQSVTSTIPHLNK